MKSILNKSFQYTPSYGTDIAKTIRREKKRLAKLRELQAKFPPKVSPIKAAK